MNDEMYYDPDFSGHPPSLEKNVKEATKGLLEALGTNKRALKQRSHLPEPSKWTLEAETVEAAFDSITVRLAFAYGWFAPDARDLTAYNEDILRPFLAGNLDSQTLLLQEKLQAPYNECLVMVIDATLAAVEALRAERSGNTNTAWKHIANAMYHLGKLEVTFRVKSLAKELHRLNGTKGVDKKELKKQPLIDYTRELAKAGNYPSMASALRALMQPVKDKAEELEYSFRTHEPLDWIESQIADIVSKRKSK